MRLSEPDQLQITQAFNTFADPNLTKIFLFGSRIDPEKKGGDIDLLVVFSNEEDKKKFLRLDFIVELKKRLGDRKLDVTLASVTELNSDPFLTSIMDKAIQL